MISLVVSGNVSSEDLIFKFCFLPEAISLCKFMDSEEREVNLPDNDRKSV